MVAVVCWAVVVVVMMGGATGGALVLVAGMRAGRVVVLMRED